MEINGICWVVMRIGTIALGTASAVIVIRRFPVAGRLARSRKLSPTGIYVAYSRRGREFDNSVRLKNLGPKAVNKIIRGAAAIFPVRFGAMEPS